MAYQDPISGRYREETPSSSASFDRARKVMPGGVKGAYYYPPYPVPMDRGDGCILYDIDGREYVDFQNHHTAQILGHRNSQVLGAVRDQLEGGIVLGAPTGLETELAEEMCTRIASLDRIRFCNSGTEATLHAIRLARGFSRKSKIAKFEGGYHGSHDLVEVSVSPALDKVGSETEPTSVSTAGGASPNAASEVVVLPYNDVTSVRKLLERHREELACVMFDPRAGILDAQRQEFVKFLRDVTAQNDLLLILDEIVAFRLSRGGFQEMYGIRPDLTTYAKIIGGGFPIGAFGGRADIMDLLDPIGGPTGFFQSGTFSGHPTAMVAGLATLKQLTPDVFAHMNGLGDRLRQGLNRKFAEKGVKATAVGTGSLFSIHFTDEDVVNYRNMARADKDKARRLHLSLVIRGYYLAPGLTMNAISAPMKAEHVNGFVEAVAEILEDDDQKA